MIHYDPLQIDRDTLVAIVRVRRRRRDGGRGYDMDIALLLDPSLAEDLERRRGFSALTRDQTVALHRRRRIASTCVALHRVSLTSACTGALVICAVRRRGRRIRRRGVIGGGLCVVWPFAMPTGWYVIGPDSGASLRSGAQGCVSDSGRRQAAGSIR